MDGSGNVYVADTKDKAIKEWIPATQTLNTLVSSGLFGPMDVAVDCSDNVYIADFREVKEWNAATRALTTLVSSPSIDARAVAVDAAGNVYIADSEATRSRSGKRRRRRSARWSSRERIGRVTWQWMVRGTSTMLTLTT